MLKSLTQWFFPYICCLCEHQAEGKQDLCETCRHSLPWLEERCYRCGLPTNSDIDSTNCQRCHETPPKFDRLCALFSYEPPLTKLIARLKFSGKLAYGRVLGELLLETVHTKWYLGKPLPQAIIPVPLHTSRLQERGFNQSSELLWPLRKTRKIPIITNACIRTRKTAHQAQLKKESRKRNMKGVFQVNKRLPFEHIALMDDVVTTGSTVSALSEVIKSNTAIDQIDIWCICRA